MKRIPKSWGYEQILVNDEYCCKKLVYARRIASSLHYHEAKQETFVVQDGIFELETTGQTRTMAAGDWVTLPPRTPHRLRCIELGTIIEASTHDDPADCVRLIESET